MAQFVRSRPSLRRLAHATVRLIPDSPWTLRKAQIGPIRIRLRQHRHLLWESFAQSDGLTLGMFERLIRPDDVVYDIGANIGLYTRVMVQWFGAGQVIAFEPMRQNAELLNANVELGAIGQQVRTFPWALSDVEGTEELQIDDMTSGTAVLTSVSNGRPSVGRQEFGLPPLTESVRVARLDDVVSRESLPPPAFMKIDTEGAEVKVLRGALNLLRTHQPRLAIALHDLDKIAGTLNLLDDLGYWSFGWVNAGSGAAQWRQVHASDAERMSNNNIAASVNEEDLQSEIQPYSR